MKTIYPTINPTTEEYNEAKTIAENTTLRVANNMLKLYDNEITLAELEVIRIAEVRKTLTEANDLWTNAITKDALNNFITNTKRKATKEKKTLDMNPGDWGNNYINSLLVIERYEENNKIA